MKHEIELFPKKYGAYFTDPAVVHRRCNPEAVTLRWPYTKQAYHEPNEGYHQYIADMRSVYADLERNVYDAALKILWLENKFGTGIRSIANSPTDSDLNAIMKEFLHNVCMVHRGLFFATKTSLLQIIRRHVDDLHPGFFEILDPFKAKLEYPYKHANLAFLVTVTEMDEAIGLMEEAERRSMNYNQFMDFLANWIACYNEKYGEKYQLKLGPAYNMYAHVYNLLDGATRSDHLVLPPNK